MKSSARIASVLGIVSIAALAGSAHGGRDSWTTSWSAFPGASALAASPTRPFLLYAGLFEVGIPSDLYASADDGRSWQSLDHPNYKNSVGAIVVAPTDPVTLFVGESGNRVYLVPASLIRSTDGGKSWSSIGPGTPWGAAIAVDPVDPRRIWSGFGGGLFVSDDGGDTWEPRAGDIFTGGVTSLAIDPGREHAIFASGYRGDANVSAKSEDGGSTWQIIGPFTCGGIAKFAIAALTGAVYAAEKFGGPCQAFTMSEDGGLTWSALAFPATANFEFADFAINPTRPEELVWASPEGTSISKDGGSTWSPLGATGLRQPGCCVSVVVFGADGESVHVAIGGTIFDYSFIRIVPVPSRPAPLIHR